MTGIMNVRRCGNCHFAKVFAQDLQRRICFGAPPSVVQVPAGPGKVTFQMTRPIVGVAEDPCALHRYKDEADRQRDDEAFEALRHVAEHQETKQ